MQQFKVSTLLLSKGAHEVAPERSLLPERQSPERAL